MKTDKVPLTLRLDAKIHEALKLISEQEMRSLNTQIEYFLRNAVYSYDCDIPLIHNTLNDILNPDADNDE